MPEPADHARPDVPGPAKEGFEWAVVTDDPARWGLAHPGTTCRSRVPGEPAHAHGVEAGVRHLRGSGRPVWWALCVPEHSEGRWAERGKVVHWEQREAGET